MNYPKHLVNATLTLTLLIGLGACSQACTSNDTVSVVDEKMEEVSVRVAAEKDELLADLTHEQEELETELEHLEKDYSDKIEQLEEESIEEYHEARAELNMALTDIDRQVDRVQKATNDEWTASRNDIKEAWQETKDELSETREEIEDFFSDDI